MIFISVSFTRQYSRLATTFNGTAENIVWNSCYLLMKQLLSIGETFVPWPMQQLFHTYCTPSTTAVVQQ